MEHWKKLNELFGLEVIGTMETDRLAKESLLSTCSLEAWCQ